ncbi:Histone-lysine N-methyltransferase SETMAR [Eumeta japonica]|uniref:Histone-lysine N-methyltransferase SETMAR n=1 Tax=Eumeta variegata TaxID=151549 RepID=A0A4C1WD26_EUMVA|nr:Histone-lysine N-methyltransferase SETMAR [Eumeta japonica]
MGPLQVSADVMRTREAEEKSLKSMRRKMIQRVDDSKKLRTRGGRRSRNLFRYLTDSSRVRRCGLGNKFPFYECQGPVVSTGSKKICEIGGEDAVDERTAQCWLNRFTADLTLVNHSRSGHPPVRDIEALKEAVEYQTSTSTRRLSDSLGPSVDIIHRHLKSSHGIYKSCRIMPHESNEI